MDKNLKKVKVPGTLKKYDWKNKVILVAEDTETSNMYFKAALTRTQAHIIWATNGNEAVSICKKEKNIDLVLMDIRMPEMDGVTATKKIKKLRPNLPVIIQTAYFYTYEKERSYEAGCDEFLTKPTKLDVLLTSIDKFIS